VLISAPVFNLLSSTRTLTLGVLRHFQCAPYREETSMTIDAVFGPLHSEEFQATSSDFLGGGGG
jgi:hypothetical protein